MATYSVPKIYIRSPKIIHKRIADVFGFAFFALIFAFVMWFDISGGFPA